MCVCVCVSPLQITSADQSEVFPDGAGGQAGHRQATLPIPHHGGRTVHHHRHVSPPQGRDAAAAGSGPELPVLKAVTFRRLHPRHTLLPELIYSCTQKVRVHLRA